jgi:threonine synthase
MSRLSDGITGDYNQPGLAPNLPSWSQKILDREAIGLVLETAHPSKFGDIVTGAVGREPPLPDRLERVLLLPDLSQPMTADYDSFRQWLMENL